MLRPVAVLAILALATPSLAAGMRGSFAGTITSSNVLIFDDPAFQSDALLPGMPFSGTFRVSDFSAGSGLASVSFTMGDLVEVTDEGFIVEIVDDVVAADGSLSDVLFFDGEPFSSFNDGHSWYEDFDISFVDEDATAFSDGSTLPASLARDAFERGSMGFLLDYSGTADIFTGESWDLTAQLHSVRVRAGPAIPEPAAVLAFGLGAVLVGAACRAAVRRGRQA